MSATKDIQSAIAEAERFIARANALLDVLAAEKAWDHKTGTYVLHAELYPTLDPAQGCSKPKERGAMRRASLDLTRALAHMRRRAS